MSKLFLDSLDKNRLTVFNKLHGIKDVGILGGGTALALQIGHRKSFDFDIFVNQKIDKIIWQKAKSVFGKDSVKLLDSEDQLNLTTPDGIGVTFFFDDYTNIFEPVRGEGIDLMNVKDIAANKALIQGKRPKWRDYIDLYFLLKEKHVDLKELIEISSQKFGTDFAEKLFLEQLVYWDDIQNYSIEFIGKEISKDEIKLFLKNEVKKFKTKSLSQDRSGI